MSTQEKLVMDIVDEICDWDEYCGDENCNKCGGAIKHWKKKLTHLIESAKREVLEEMRPANATIESMRIYTPRTHTYMGKEYPACGICGFCPEAMNAFIDAQLEQSEESI